METQVTQCRQNRLNILDDVLTILHGLSHIHCASLWVYRKAASHVIHTHLESRQSTASRRNLQCYHGHFDIWIFGIAARTRWRMFPSWFRSLLCRCPTDTTLSIQQPIGWVQDNLKPSQMQGNLQGIQKICCVSTVIMWLYILKWYLSWNQINSSDKKPWQTWGVWPCCSF